MASNPENMMLPIDIIDAYKLAHNLECHDKQCGQIPIERIKPPEGRLVWQ